MKSVIAIFIIVAAISGSAWWAWRDAAPVVEVAIVARGEVKHSSPGRVEVLAERIQQLRSLRSGRVESVIITPNAASRKVAEGEVIIQLETRNVELTLEEIRASLRETFQPFGHDG